MKENNMEKILDLVQMMEGIERHRFAKQLKQ